MLCFKVYLKCVCVCEIQYGTIQYACLIGFNAVHMLLEHVILLLQNGIWCPLSKPRNLSVFENTFNE
jgi:hypothetical protein